jgi:ubiquinone/menaquinone biosynthesis C-methylase UbiE
MRRLSVVAALVVAVLVAAVAAQGRHPVSGRTIAPVMGVGGAGWLDRPERDQEEDTSRAVASLDLRPGMVVADIGAGSGYYTVRMANKVGPSGKVYATDIQQGMLDLLTRRVTRERLTQVVPVLGTADDPRLPPGVLDLALMVDVYHELSAPQAFIRRLRESLKPDGRLVLIEYRKEDPRVPIREEHKMSVAQVRQELAADGFTIEKVIDVLPWQHVIVLQSR